MSDFPLRSDFVALIKYLELGWKPTKHLKENLVISGLINFPFNTFILISQALISLDKN